MLKLLSLISKNFIIAIPISLLLGFAFGLVAPTAWLKSLIIPLTFLMVYPMMVTLKLKKVMEGGDGKAQLPLAATFFPINRFTPWGCCSRPCCRPAA